MKRFMDSRLTKCVKYRSYILVFLLLIFVGAMTLLGFTQEKFHKIEVHKTDESVKVKNIGCNEEMLNPLREGEHPDIENAVKTYFTKLMEEQRFAEKYDNLRIYTKKGQYQGIYVVFVRYRMKIKGIFTEVPGLATLYAEKEHKKNEYRVGTENPEGQDQEYVRRLTGHKDVQSLFEKTEKEYRAAVQSDALLNEALADLKKAYADSSS